jgi:heat shock protein HslJ
MNPESGGVMIKMISQLVTVLLIFGCAAGGPPGPSARSDEPQRIVNRTWQWEATITPVERITVPAPERYTIFLKEDGMAQVRFDCNRGGGGYTVSKGGLSFGPLMSTRMACPEGSLDARFAKDLQAVSSFFIEEGRLHLELPYDSGTMRFREGP